MIIKSNHQTSNYDRDMFIQTIKTPIEAIEAYTAIRDLISEQKIYEAYGYSWRIEKTTMPARIWLSVRIAQAWDYLDETWNAWKEYQKAFNDSLANHEIKRVIQPLWDSVPADGDRLATEFPKQVIRVGPDKNTYSAKTILDEWGRGKTNSNLWFVPEDGWLIHGFEISATILPHPTREIQSYVKAYGFVPHTNPPELEIQVEADRSRSPKTIRKTLDWQRGIRAVQVRVRKEITCAIRTFIGGG